MVIPTHRTARGAAKAVLYLTLEPGAYNEEHAEQKHQINDLKRMAYRYLGQGMSERSDKEREFYLQRRAFRKVSLFTSMFLT